MRREGYELQVGRPKVILKDVDGVKSEPYETLVIDVPEELIKRMESVPKDKQRKEGINICVETILKLKEMPGVKGVHIMAIEWEEAVGEIVERSGLLPRPSFD